MVQAIVGNPLPFVYMFVTNINTVRHVYCLNMFFCDIINNLLKLQQIFSINKNFDL